ncbi:hypothetical protein [Collinsella aerofaciens]|uniref:hypothetical protein n=1 Tax=Collinsella aerofaciens TaxID=74426 RepID=UPI003D78E9EB
MPTDIKGLYKSYLEGRTDIQTIDTYGGGRGLFLKENWDGSWAAMSNVGSDNCAVHSFEDKALAVGYLLGVSMGQLDMMDSILKAVPEYLSHAKDILSDALFSPAPASRVGSLIENNRAFHTDELSGVLKRGEGVYDPTHALYIDSTVGSGDSPTITFHRVDLGDIETCLQYGFDSFSDVPDFANSVVYRPPLAVIPISGADDPKIGYLAATLAGDGRWCDVSVLDTAQFNRLMDVFTKNNDIVNDILLHGEQNKDSVEQAVDLLGKAKAIGGEYMEAVDGVLAISFDRLGSSPFDAVDNLLNLYAGADDAARGAIAETFQTLTGKPFDSFVEVTVEQCELLLGPYSQGESLDEMMEQKVELAGDGEIGDEISVSNGER